MSDSNSHLHSFSRNTAAKTAVPKPAPRTAAVKSPAPSGDAGAPPSDAAAFRRTATRADILDGVFAACPGVSRSQAREVFEMALEEVCETLKRGESVKLRSFGHFNVREKRERIGRNPRTGVEVPIKPRRVLTFKASPVLLDQVNGRETHGDDHEADERGH